MDLETCTSLTGHPSHRWSVKVGVVTLCEPQLLVHIFICCVVSNVVFVRNVRGP